MEVTFTVHNDIAGKMIAIERKTMCFCPFFFVLHNCHVNEVPVENDGFPAADLQPHIPITIKPQKLTFGAELELGRLVFEGLVEAIEPDLEKIRDVEPDARRCKDPFPHLENASVKVDPTHTKLTSILAKANLVHLVGPRALVPLGVLEKYDVTNFNMAFISFMAFMASIGLLNISFMANMANMACIAFMPFFVAFMANMAFMDIVSINFSFMVFMANMAFMVVAVTFSFMASMVFLVIA
jgi:hypothetical protein